MMKIGFSYTLKQLTNNGVNAHRQLCAKDQRIFTAENIIQEI